MKREYLYIILAVILSLVVWSLALFPVVSAAPPAAPTPVANLYTDGASQSLNVTFKSQTVITADEDTACIQLPNYEQIDVWYYIDQTDINTVTITGQFTSDPACAAAGLVAGPVLVSANAADAADIVRYAMFGRYMSFDVNVANTNEVTVTILGTAK